MSEIDYGRLENKITIGQLRAKQATLGDCFAAAALEVILNHDTHPEATMVTGFVPNSYQGAERVHHAWCELLGTVTYEVNGEQIEKEEMIMVDNTQPDPNARFIPAGLFYEQVKPTDVRRYTYDEMMREIDNPRDWPV